MTKRNHACTELIAPGPRDVRNVAKRRQRLRKPRDRRLCQAGPLGEFTVAERCLAWAESTQNGETPRQALHEGRVVILQESIRARLSANGSEAAHRRLALHFWNLIPTNEIRIVKPF
jgi:hypothetical protein